MNTMIARSQGCLQAMCKGDEGDGCEWTRHWRLFYCCANRFSFFVHNDRSAVLNLFRVADHLTNFVSVRGPHKKFLHFLWEISEFLTTFLVIFPNFSRFADHTKNFYIF